MSGVLREMSSLWEARSSTRTTRSPPHVHSRSPPGLSSTACTASVCAGGRREGEIRLCTYVHCFLPCSSNSLSSSAILHTVTYPWEWLSMIYISNATLLICTIHCARHHFSGCGVEVQTAHFVIVVKLTLHRVDPITHTHTHTAPPVAPPTQLKPHPPAALEALACVAMDQRESTKSAHKTRVII